MAIITHALINDVIYMYVICPMDDVFKWVTLEEALGMCPTAVIQYTQLTFTHVFSPPVENPEPSMFD
ncbi:GH24304 [Drosophila grimshawi]|uniref:GH24304 n=1 Tax=Drosophila grimshawi TaxID=7222 RepID=B4JML4_DROGR|nr:GH24304 [Drosophila grimshawi]